MNTQEIVQKLWNLCNVLRDDGITYHEYVTELTYILFLKMAKETGAEAHIPEAWRWDVLAAKSGLELKNYYQQLLSDLGRNSQGRIREIYEGAQTKIDEPKNLEKIIRTIDELDWFSAKEEGLGNLYEGLLEKNASEKKSGAGQYFTPRVLIDVMVRLMQPQPGERCNDPACGTFGFMIAAHEYVRQHTDDFFDLDQDTANFEAGDAFTGCELVHDTHRLALMNAMLHDMNGKIVLGDTLSSLGESFKDFDLVLTNIWSPSRISPLRSPMVSRCPLPGFQQICSQMSTAWSDGPVDSWEHICYRFPEGATDLKYPYATYHV